MYKKAIKRGCENMIICIRLFSGSHKLVLNCNRKWSNEYRKRKAIKKCRLLLFTGNDVSARICFKWDYSKPRILLTSQFQFQPSYRRWQNIFKILWTSLHLQVFYSSLWECIWMYVTYSFTQKIIHEFGTQIVYSGSNMSWYNYRNHVPAGII